MFSSITKVRKYENWRINQVFQTAKNPGKIRHFLFDGSNDIGTLASEITLAGAFTIGFWGKATGEGAYSIVGNQAAYGDGRIAFNNTSNVLRMDCTGAKTGTFNLDDTSSDSRWHYYIIIREATTNVISFYRDNIELGNTIGNAVTWDGEFQIDVIGGTSGGSGFVSWKGGLREFRIYSRAITIAEMNKLQNNESISATSLEGYWKMNEPSGNSVIDYSGNGRTLTLANQTAGTFYTSYTPATFYGDRIVNGNFAVVSGTDPGTPWNVTDSDDDTNDLIVSGSTCQIKSDGGTAQMTQTAIVNKFDTIKISANLSDVTSGSMTVGSSATASARYQSALSTLGLNTFNFITDDVALLIKRTAACNVSFQQPMVNKVRNLLTNGDFRKVVDTDKPKNWSATPGDGTITWEAGKCRLYRSGANNPEIKQSILVVGYTYRVTFLVDTMAAGTGQVYSVAQLATFNTTGWKTFTFTQPAGGSSLFFLTQSAGADFKITSIICERI